MPPKASNYKGKRKVGPYPIPEELLHSHGIVIEDD